MHEVREGEGRRGEVRGGKGRRREVREDEGMVVGKEGVLKHYLHSGVCF